MTTTERQIANEEHEIRDILMKLRGRRLTPYQASLLRSEVSLREYIGHGGLSGGNILLPETLGCLICEGAKAKFNMPVKMPDTKPEEPVYMGRVEQLDVFIESWHMRNNRRISE